MPNVAVTPGGRATVLRSTDSVEGANRVDRQLDVTEVPRTMIDRRGRHTEPEDGYTTLSWNCRGCAQRAGDAGHHHRVLCRCRRAVWLSDTRLNSFRS